MGSFSLTPHFSPLSSFIFFYKCTNMNDPYTLKLYILTISIIIALLSYTHYYLNWKQGDEDKQFASTPFYIAHVFDPAIDGYRFTSWNRQDWVTWLNNRETLHKKAKANRRAPLNQKPLNSVLIASAQEVLNAFHGRQYPYNPEVKDNMYWSESLFHSFVFEMKGTVYRVFKCPPMYIAVVLENGMPVHMHEHSKRREKRNFKVKVTKDCVEIK